MATYRIVCTNQEPFGQPHSHAHIVTVGTGNDPAKADTRRSLDEVLQAMDRGDTFYTRGITSGRVAQVEKYHCTPCRRTYIRSAPDAVQDNNLDNLRTCNWQ
jgi:hypothetical protein